MWVGYPYRLHNTVIIHCTYRRCSATVAQLTNIISEYVFRIICNLKVNDEMLLKSILFGMYLIKYFSFIISTLNVWFRMRLIQLCFPLLVLFYDITMDKICHFCKATVPCCTTRGDRDKINALLQAKFSHALSGKTAFVFWLKSSWFYFSQWSN